jgi:hypothetical protein
VNLHFDVISFRAKFRPRLQTIIYLTIVDQNYWVLISAKIQETFMHLFATLILLYVNYGRN